MKPACAPDTSSMNTSSMKRFVIGYTLLLLAIKILADFGLIGFALDQLEYVPGNDKTLHFLLAGSFALVLNAAFFSRAQQTRPTAGLIAATVPGTLLAVLGTTCDELSNLLFVSRGWSLADLAANYLGILFLGVLPMAVYTLVFRSHRTLLLTEGSVSTG